MFFRQLFEPLSSTYTYLLGCEETRQAMLIDPVLPSWERDLCAIRDLGLTLAYSVDTHIHADHLTAAYKLKQQVGSKIAGPGLDQLPCTDIPLEEGTPFCMGSVQLDPLHTPGHTDNHFAYRLGDRLFSGDALLIDGCGRTDFKNGDATALYHSINENYSLCPARPWSIRHMTIVAAVFQVSRRKSPATHALAETKRRRILSRKCMA